MSSDDFAIRVRDVSKRYLMYRRPEDRLKQMIVPRLERLVGRRPRAYFDEFAALDGVSFDIRRGETVGIIGRNGSGKSTLLQIVCGTLRPSSGTVDVNGRIAALLELGAGFNPEFTGRENVYLNAAILGLSRAHVDERFEAIARFADIGAFIDQPVKTYSSGMYVRLAFATAINVDPDILVVDEALAVGDEAFQRKCFARIEEIQDRGGTILFVSHGVQTIVQLCSRALLFDAGELLLEGRPKLVTGQYQRLVNLTGEEARAVRQEIRALADAPAEERTEAQAMPDALLKPPAAPKLEPAPTPAQPISPALVSSEGLDPALTSQSRVDYESHGARIRDLRLLNSKGEQVNILEMGRRYTYEYHVEFEVEATNLGFGMMINTKSGLALAGASTGMSKTFKSKHVTPGSSACVRLEFICSLLPGTYFMNAGVLGTVDGHERYLHRILDGIPFRVAPAEEIMATGLVDLGVRPEIVIKPAGQQEALRASERIAANDPLTFVREDAL